MATAERRLMEAYRYLHQLKNFRGIWMMDVQKMQQSMVNQMIYLAGLEASRSVRTIQKVLGQSHLNIKAPSPSPNKRSGRPSLPAEETDKSSEQPPGSTPAPSEGESTTTPS